MITIHGVEYGTAAELAAVLGPDVTPRMIRHWADRDGLTAHHLPGPGRGTVVYALDQAATIEASKRRSPRGRPRTVPAA